MKYYQPVYDEKEWERERLFSWQVFACREVAESVFPTLFILEYQGNDIEDYEIVDDQFMPGVLSKGE